MGPSFSTMPPFTFLEGLARVCRLMMLACSTVTVRRRGLTPSTRPVLPLSRPLITRTWSPLRMPALVMVVFMNLSSSSAPASPDLRGQRYDFGKFLLAQFARYRTEYARAHGLVGVVDGHRGIVVKADVGAIPPAMLLARAHHHGAHHLALLDGTLRGRFLHRRGYDIAQPGPAADVAAYRQNAHQAARSGIIGHGQPASHLNHCRALPLP